MCNTVCASGDMHRIECDLFVKADFEVIQENFPSISFFVSVYLRRKLKIFLSMMTIMHVSCQLGKILSPLTNH